MVSYVNHKEKIGKRDHLDWSNWNKRFHPRILQYFRLHLRTTMMSISKWRFWSGWSRWKLKSVFNLNLEIYSLYSHAPTWCIYIIYINIILSVSLLHTKLNVFHWRYFFCNITFRSPVMCFAGPKSFVALATASGSLGCGFIGNHSGALTLRLRWR